MRDAVNKAARLVINHCIGNKIGTIVFGWNVGQKDGRGALITPLKVLIWTYSRILYLWEYLPICYTHLLH